MELASEGDENQAMTYRAYKNLKKWSRAREDHMMTESGAWVNCAGERGVATRTGRVATGAASATNSPSQLIVFRNSLRTSACTLRPLFQHRLLPSSAQPRRADEGIPVGLQETPMNDAAAASS